MRDNLQVELVAAPQNRFARRAPGDFERIAEAKARLVRPLRRAGGA